MCNPIDLVEHRTELLEFLLVDGLRTLGRTTSGQWNGLQLFDDIFLLVHDHPGGFDRDKPSSKVRSILFPLAKDKS